MPASVSIAFAMSGGLSRTEAVQRALRAAGASVSEAERYDDSATADIVLPLGAHHLDGVLRLFDEEGWCSVTIEVDAEAYSAAADALGRADARDALIALAATLGEALQLAYALLDEEIDAETAPHDTDAIPLVGVTLLPEGSPALPRLRSRPEVKRTQQHGSWTALLRRLDPIPHHPDA